MIAIKDYTPPLGMAVIGYITVTTKEGIDTRQHDRTLLDNRLLSLYTYIVIDDAVAHHSLTVRPILGRLSERIADLAARDDVVEYLSLVKDKAGAKSLNTGSCSGDEKGLGLPMGDASCFNCQSRVPGKSGHIEACDIYRDPLTFAACMLKEAATRPLVDAEIFYQRNALACGRHTWDSKK